MQVKEERVFRNKYKRHMDKTKGWWDQMWELGMAGMLVGEANGDSCS